MIWFFAVGALAVFTFIYCWRQFSGSPGFLWGCIAGLVVGMSIATLVPGLLMPLSISGTLVIVGAFVVLQRTGVLDDRALDFAGPTAAGVMYGIGLACLNAWLQVL